MERELGAIVAEHLKSAGLAGTASGAQCRTSACQIAVETTAGDREAVEAYFQAFAPLGKSMSFEEEELPDGGVTITFTTVYDAAWRSPGDFRVGVQAFATRRQDAWKRTRPTL